MTKVKAKLQNFKTHNLHHIYLSFADCDIKKCLIVTYMWIGYSLDRQCGREGVLNGSRGGGGVGSQYDGM